MIKKPDISDYAVRINGEWIFIAWTSEDKYYAALKKYENFQRKSSQNSDTAVQGSVASKDE